MIYLPGEAPKRFFDAKKVLSKILDEPQDDDKKLVEQVLKELSGEGPKDFPKGFVQETALTNATELAVPGTILEPDRNSPTTVVSPRRHFRYNARNPSEAKFIVYAHRVGERKIRIPSDNKTLFQAVTNYETYCKALKNRCF